MDRNNAGLNLTLSLPRPPPPPPPPPVPPNPKIDVSSEENQVQEGNSSSRKRWRQGKPRALTVKQGKSDTISPPYPWATSKRATVHSLEHLLTQGIRTIRGKFKCKKCEAQRDVEFDLEEKFHEIAQIIADKRCEMHDRAPEAWTKPVLPNCEGCGKKNSVKPVIEKKRTINWLFLLLGQMIGCCTISELKYFCKHTKNHSTGAKNRLVYLPYLALCKQLDPQGPYNV